MKEAANEAGPPNTRNKPMTGREKELLVALAMVVRQYLSENGDTIYGDNSAGERVIKVLTAFGLMEPVNAVISRWTEEGKKFLAENTNVPLKPN